MKFVIRRLPSRQVKEKLLEFLRADDSLELGENRIRQSLGSLFSAKFDKIVNWKHWGHNNLPEWITKNISKEEATEGQFPVRCFTQDLYNRGYDNDMVRHHQLLWEFEDFWTTLPE